jgi:hypothetical protein
MVLGGTVIVCVTVTWAVAGDVGGEGVEVSGDAVVAEEGVLAKEAPPLVTVGEMIVGVVVDVDEVHAETATGTSRVRAPQQRTLSLALSGVPAIDPRTFMDPSSCAGQMTIVFPFPAAETGIPERKTRNRSGRRPRRHRQVPMIPTAIKACAVSGADAQWPVHHRNIRLTE